MCFKVSKIAFMKIHFLGTGTSQGIPVIGSQHPVCLSNDPKDQRLRVSVWVEMPYANIIIDCGPDFRSQMLRSKCPSIDAILFTHEHADHTAGLDDIRPFYFSQGAIPIYAHQRVVHNLRRRFDYILNDENKYPGAPSVLVREIENNQNFSVGPYEIIPIEFLHGNLQVFGFRMENFAYLTDVKTIKEVEIQKLKNLEILVVNALRNEPHDTHFNLEDALAFIKIVQPKKAYLTHISHRMGFHEEISKELPENVFLAYDTLTLEINSK